MLILLLHIFAGSLTCTVTLMFVTIVVSLEGNYFLHGVYYCRGEKANFVGSNVPGYISRQSTLS